MWGLTGGGVNPVFASRDYSGSTTVAPSVFCGMVHLSLLVKIYGTSAFRGPSLTCLFACVFRCPEGYVSHHCLVIIGGGVAQGK